MSATLAWDEPTASWLALGSSPQLGRMPPRAGRSLLAAGAARTVLWCAGNRRASGKWCGRLDVQ